MECVHSLCDNKGAQACHHESQSKEGMLKIGEDLARGPAFTFVLKDAVHDHDCQAGDLKESSVCLTLKAVRSTLRTSATLLS
jgi:hypothetical protein